MRVHKIVAYFLIVYSPKISKTKLFLSFSLRQKILKSGHLEQKLVPTASFKRIGTLIRGYFLSPQNREFAGITVSDTGE